MPEKGDVEKLKNTDSNWYALHVYSGQEHKVKHNLEREIKRSGLEEKFGDILIPSEDVVEMRQGKKKVKNRVFFPGYILVSMVLDNETQNAIINVPGVINFVGVHNKPQMIQVQEIDRILKKVYSKEEKEKVAVPFSIGEMVRVIDGPFNDFQGIVEEINLEKNKVKVMVSIFGRPTPVELDFLQVTTEK